MTVQPQRYWRRAARCAAVAAAVAWKKMPLASSSARLGPLTLP